MLAALVERSYPKKKSNLGRSSRKALWSKRFFFSHSVLVHKAGILFFLHYLSFPKIIICLIKRNNELFSKICVIDGMNHAS